jgi:Ca2+-transporting ATPase
MARKKAIIKKLPIVETLGCVNVICSDKTGTLTTNEMTVRNIISSDDLHAEVTGKGYVADGIVRCGNVQVRYNSHPSLFKVIECGAVCNNAHIFDRQVTGQPTDASLLTLAMKASYNELRNDYIRHEEWPFNSDNKWMGVRVSPKNNPSQTIIFIKGAINEVLKQSKYYNFNERSYELTQEKYNHFVTHAQNLMSSGLRVIAMATGPSFSDLCYVGMVGIIDPPREGIRDAIESLRHSGVQVKMITGDAQETAKAIANRIGFDLLMKKCLSGEEINQMSPHELENAVSDVAIFYRTTPKQKLNIIKAFKNRGYIVGMTGDGVNDSVALKSADIGIAMGKSGTDVSKEAADMILVDDNFTTIL